MAGKVVQRVESRRSSGAGSRDHASLGRELQQLAERTFSERSVAHLGRTLADGCWIYGAGGYGRTVLGLVSARGIPCYGFIDRRGGAGERLAVPLERRVSGPVLVKAPLPVVTADQFPQSEAQGRTLIVALHNFAADQAPIVRWARDLGFAQILIPAELPDLLGQDAGSYWLTGRRHTASHLEELTTLFGMLADARSVETVFAAARFRISGDIEEHPAADISDQYFPRDLPLPPGPVRLVDGGAYTGDTYDGATTAGVVIEEWHAFEPDPDNFRQLVETAATTNVKRVALFPCGLGETCQQVRFSAGGADGSHAVSEGLGETTAQIVALDEVLPGIDPTLVKLDIEGFERQALDGMRETLARSRPRLAMSIYHKPEDLWELPFKVRELMPDARLYVRQHGFNGFDTVLYAIPPS